MTVLLSARLGGIPASKAVSSLVYGEGAIAYFDTSTLVPLIVEEAGSDEVKRLWRDAERVMSATVVYAERHAALASAARLGRHPADRLRAAVGELVDHYEELHLVVISDRLVRRAGALVKGYALCGHDSIHLAAAELPRGDNTFVFVFVFVFVAGDCGLCAGSGWIGLEVVRSGGGQRT